MHPRSTETIAHRAVVPSPVRHRQTRGARPISRRRAPCPWREILLRDISDAHRSRARALVRRTHFERARADVEEIAGQGPYQSGLKAITGSTFVARRAGT